MRWYTRAWTWTTSPILRALGYADTSKPITLGADYAAFVPAISAFDERTAEAATGSFPWLAATVNRKAGDLSSLPWAASLGGYGTKGRAAVGHPVLAILEQPNTAEAGSLFWRQILCELYKCGEAYAIKVRDARGRWIGLLFVPSPRLSPIVGPSGFPVAYQDGQSVQYAARDVVHWRFPGSSDDPSRLAGVGYVQPLKQTLDGEYAIKARQAANARQGRPSALATPGDDVGVLGPDQVRAVREELDTVFRQRSGGIAILGRKLKVDALDWKPVDLGSDEQLDRARMEVLAVTGVPPVRVGLETANYATADKQEEIYWGSELSADSALVDDVLTMHARIEFGPADLYVYRDFRAVPALQARRDAALNRAKTLVDLGVDPGEALQSEGIDDVKIAPKPEPAPAPAPTADPAIDNVVPMRGWWGDIVSRDAAPVDREKLWRSWQAKVHAPNEIRVAREVRAVLTAQADGVAGRLGEILPSGRHARNIVADLVAALFPDDWTIWGDVRSKLSAAISDGITAGAAQVAVTPTLDATTLDTVTDHQLATLVTKTTQSTRDDLRAILTAGIADGASVSELQRRIRESATFSPVRALAIARTETTRALGAGTDLAYKGAVDTGAKVLVRWLSARLRHTREAHLALDGQAVHVGEPFVVPSGEYKGQTARFPGDFAVAALVVNCVCTTIAEVE
jgi:phage portal protein BeeE